VKGEGESFCDKDVLAEGFGEDLVGRGKWERVSVERRGVRARPGDKVVSLEMEGGEND